MADDTHRDKATTHIVVVLIIPTETTWNVLRMVDMYMYYIWLTKMRATITCKG